MRFQPRPEFPLLSPLCPKGALLPCRYLHVGTEGCRHQGAPLEKDLPEPQRSAGQPKRTHLPSLPPCFGVNMPSGLEESRAADSQSMAAASHLCWCAWPLSFI